MIFVTVETAEEEDAVREALKRLPVRLPFAIKRPGGGGEYAAEPTFAVTGAWSAPPEITDCPVTGYAAVDDFRYDMCVCGKRHVTVTAYGPDDRPL